MLRFEKVNQKDREQAAKKTQETHDAVMAAAQNCLNHELFQKYTLEYENLQEKVLSELMILDQVETDPVRYGFQCKDIIARLRHLGALMRGVRQEAGK